LRDGKYVCSFPVGQITGENYHAIVQANMKISNDCAESLGWRVFVRARSLRIAASRQRQMGDEKTRKPIDAAAASL
jgi:hypothetical protein